MLKLNVTSAVAGALLFSLLTCAAARPDSAARDQVARLTAVLQSGASHKEKADACRELGRIGTRESIPVLAGLLGDDQLSHMARYALEPMPDAAAGQALRDALNTVKGRPLVGVIGSVGFRRDAKAVGRLAELLKTSDPEVVQAAARALGRIGGRTAVESLQKALGTVAAGNRAAVCEGLFRAAEGLAASGKRRDALAIYGRLRESETAPSYVRAGAWQGSILHGGKGGLTLLSEALKSEDKAIFNAGLQAAMELPGKAVTPVLIETLGVASPDRQVRLVQALSKRGDASALPVLSKAARNCAKPVRIAVIRALAELQDPAAAGLLEDLLNDAEPEVTAAASEALASLPGKQIDARLLAMLKSAEPRRCLAGMDLVARRRMTDALQELVKLSAGPNPTIRRAALKKVGEVGGSEQIPVMLQLVVSSGTTEDLEGAEQALGALAVKETDADAFARKVGSHLGQARPAAQCALLRVLGVAGSAEALKLVRASLKNSEGEVRSTAIRVLNDWRNADAAPDLLEVAKTSSNPTEKTLCLRGYLAFASQGDVPPKQRLEMCRQAATLVQKDDEKKLLLAALGNINAPEALDMIQPYLDDAAIKEEACTAIVNLCERMMRRDSAAKNASRVITPLEKVAALTGNEGLAKRAKNTLDQARAEAKKE